MPSDLEDLFALQPPRRSPRCPVAEMSRYWDELGIPEVSPATPPPQDEPHVLDLCPLSWAPKHLVTGGQTGVDRAVLDWSLEHGIRHRGWCPRGRLAEDGALPPEYPLRETATADYAERTWLNVRDSYATLILNEGPLEDGTRLTLELAKSLKRPVQVVQLDDPAIDAPRAILDWLREGHFISVNVAGPRESSRPGIYQRVYQLLEDCATLALNEHHRRDRRELDVGVNQEKNMSPEGTAEGVGRPAQYEKLVAAYPGLIPLPRIERPHRGMRGTLADIEQSQDLPSRLIFGDLVEDSFTGQKGEWAAQYRDESGNGLTLSVSEGRFTARPVFLGRKGFSIGPADHPKAFASLLSLTGSDWDRVLKEYLEARFPLFVSVPTSDRPMSMYLPDGWLRTLLLPVRPEMLPNLLAMHQELQGDPALAAGLMANVYLAPNSVNYVEGKCDALGLRGEGSILVYSLRTMNSPLYGATRETGTDGSAAWTLRRQAYLYVCSAFLRDMPLLVDRLNKFGMLHNYPDLIAAILPAEDVALMNECSWWSLDRSCRINWHDLHEHNKASLDPNSWQGASSAELVSQAVEAARHHADYFQLDEVIDGSEG